VGTDSINAAMEAAAENQSDIIVQLSNGGAHFYAGSGIKDDFEAKVLGAVSAAHHVHLLAKHYGICVVLHTDHANRKLIPWLNALIDHSEKYFDSFGYPLYSSHMLDLSEEDIEKNLSECVNMLSRMARIDMSLEIELGITGGEEDGVGKELEENSDNAHLYTQPEDVLKAYERLSSIGHFSVAASFGNVHGVYKPGNVQLRPEILKNSQELVSKVHNIESNPLNFVFHGGSGSEKKKISEALTYGVFKMNIDTDTQFAFSKAVGTYVHENANAFKYQIDPQDGTPYKKEYDPRKWLRAGKQGFISRLSEAMNDLGSSGKSLAM
jgi:fructose-bisphosphate aldolase class II